MRALAAPCCLLVLLCAVQACPAAETEAPTMVTVAGLQPHTEVWDTYLGCLQGCLEYLHAEVSPAWLYGISGHAFGLNIHRQLCPSGPHVWSGWGNLQDHEALLGLSIERVGPWYRGYDDDYEAHKRVAWERTRAALAAGTPCIGYDLNWAEFYVINGHDETGYYYWKTDMGAMDATGPVPWEQLGEVGVVHMVALQYVTVREPVGTPRRAVRAALQWAVRFGERGDAGDPMRAADYVSGLAAYDQWVAALYDPAAWEGDAMGAMYNAQVWRECRHQAVAFLQEARQRLADRELDPLFDDAIAHYSRVERELGIVCEQFWYDSPAAQDPQPERQERAQRALRAAERAEAQGLQALARIVARL